MISAQFNPVLNKHKRGVFQDDDAQRFSRCCDAYLFLHYRVSGIRLDRSETNFLMAVNKPFRIRRGFCAGGP